MYCNNCGQQIDDRAAFCPNCGARRVGAPEPGAAPAPQAGPGGMAENVASGLSDLFGWVTGIVFFLIDSRPAVKFHAAQSIIVFGGLSVLRLFLGIFWGMGAFLGRRTMLWPGFGFGFGFTSLITLTMLVLWVLLLVKGFQGEHFKLPIAGDIAENWSRG
jgi:uncharacterized membrane protein